MTDHIRKLNIGSRNTVNKVILSGLGASSLRSVDVSLDGTIYGVDTSRHMVYKIFEDGRLLGALDGHVSTSGHVNDQGLLGSTGLTARLSSPVGLCVDASGNIYVGDQSSTLILKISSSGRCVDYVGLGGTSGDAVADDARSVRFGGGGLGLAVDAAGVLYVADTANHKIKKVLPGGKTVVLAGGNASNSGNVNGNGQTARFSSPQDVAVAPDGTVYVADTGNNRIRKIDTSGNVVTLAGGASGFVDGIGNAALFNSPRRICLTPDGKFGFVLDHGNNCIRRFDMHGNVTTLCPWLPTTTGTGDLMMDNSGFLYVLENNS